MRDPFLIEGPAVISFSGGRTSGYMLWRILQAHQWVLPDDVKVIFANTGKEMPETLDFVRDCGVHWNVPITWVEYRAGRSHAKVDHASASRNGEPFHTLIVERRYLPNPVARFCTAELKIRAMARAIKEQFGFDSWTACIGIRADEPRRIAKMLRSNEAGDIIAPLYDANIRVGDVGKFWAAHSFDLKLPSVNGRARHGNCDLCFLKGGDQLLSLIRENPNRAVWWMEQEQYSADTFVVRTNGGNFQFRNDRPSYASMYRMATQHGELFPFDDEPLQDCMCTD